MHVYLKQNSSWLSLADSSLGMLTGISHKCVWNLCCLIPYNDHSPLFHFSSSPLFHHPHSWSVSFLSSSSSSPPASDEVFPTSLLNEPACKSLPPEKLGGCVNASEAYFYTHVCPESDVVYHSLSQRPIVQHSKKNVVIWTVSASARLSLGQFLDEIRLFPLGDCALLVPGAKLENEPRWLFLARLTSGRNLLGFNGILLLLVAFCLTPGQPKLGYCLESCMKYNRAPAICWGTFLHRVYFEEGKKYIVLGRQQLKKEKKERKQ